MTVILCSGVQVSGEHLGETFNLTCGILLVKKKCLGLLGHDPYFLRGFQMP